jgi:hypothetical protein
MTAAGESSAMSSRFITSPLMRYPHREFRDSARQLIAPGRSRARGEGMGPGNQPMDKTRARALLNETIRTDTLLTMSTEQTYSINAAAKMTGYSIPTVRKRLPELQRYGAVQIDGRWQIPLSALHAAGLTQRVTSNGESKNVDPDLLNETTTEVEGLRAQLAEALRRAEVAEAIAEERERALQRADKALLMLEGLRAPAGPTAPARTSWWRRSQ